MSRPIALLRAAAVAALLLSFLAPSALAQADSWAVAQRDEAGILKVVKATQKFVYQVPGGADAGAVILYKETNFRAVEKMRQERERQVVELTLRGHSADAIGKRLEISPGTVRIHRRNIYSKLRISSQGELFSLFIEAMLGDEPR